MKFFTFKSWVAAAGLALTAWSSIAAPVTAPTVTYDLVNRNLIITPSGTQDLTLAAGEAFTVTGTWSSTFLGGGGCNSCYIQAYLAGLPGYGVQGDLFDPKSQGSNPSYYYSNGSGSYSFSFVAPTVAGTYYLGGGFSPDFGFITGVTGSANSNNLVSYAITVAEVPEPTSLALVGLALCGLAVKSRRRA